MHKLSIMIVYKLLVGTFIKIVARFFFLIDFLQFFLNGFKIIRLHFSDALDIIVLKQNLCKITTNINQHYYY